MHILLSVVANSSALSAFSDKRPAYTRVPAQGQGTVLEGTNEIHGAVISRSAVEPLGPGLVMMIDGIPDRVAEDYKAIVLLMVAGAAGGLTLATNERDFSRNTAAMHVFSVALRPVRTRVLPVP
ncbi:hypothetical protein AJ80_05449 [Polytolypa hystricis UAMH7299]|uniref:Uncharacterized protein n=1 Tax=Polytolypa hystricis (strain UAMH7299) TaxID=1447883 RepID=A0A2B7Y3W9_POLH7|nr:hypothetical protein AJ80_05449 [Polytolypa hystricis UAMH7299]